MVGIAAFYAKLFGKKHLHRTAHLIDVNSSWIENNGIAGKIYKYGLLNANKIVTQNKEHKELLLQNHAINADILKNAFEIKNNQPHEKKNILWVGRFESWKNPVFFLNLAKTVSTHNFTMICPANENNKQEWKAFQKKTLRIPNLTFIEQVPFSEIQSYFNEAQIFINTSDFEGFPNTFLQAAQAKTPIISLNVNPDNFLNEYNCGIFCNNDFDSMVEQTKKLLNNKQELQLKGENCYRYLKKNHDINVIGKQLEEIIFSLK